MLQKKITFDSFIRGILSGIVIIGILYLVNRLSGVLLPFFVAWLIAYLIYPMVTFFQYKLRLKNRVISIFAVMLVLITYDVNTETNAGKTRLRKVAKQCTNYGRRVQNSVFECIVDNAQCVELKAILSDIIDKNLDSLRFYYLGNNYQTKIEHIGIERGISVDQVLFL